MVLTFEERQRMQARARLKDRILLRRWKLKRMGITLEDFEATVETQAGLCAICTDPVELVADHDHATGEFRGALCRRCNLGLGYFRDDPALLHNAVFYLGYGVEQKHG